MLGFAGGLYGMDQEFYLNVWFTIDIHHQNLESIGPISPMACCNMGTNQWFEIQQSQSIV